MYYLPIWFQAIDGLSAVNSGIHLLPMMMPIVVASIITGQLVSRIGYYTPFMIFGVCLSAIGAGLLTTLEIGSKSKWIGFQIVYGFGLGCSSQAPNMAAQTVLSREDVAIGATLMFFGLQLFGAVFISVCQNVLDNHLANRLAGIPGGISPRLIQSTGATELLNLIPAQYHAAALEAYNDSLRMCFQVGLIVACLSILGALGMEWRSVKKNLPPKNPDGERAAEEAKGKGQGCLSEKEAPEAEAEAEAVMPVAAADAENDKDGDAAAAVLTVSTEATRTASQTEVAHASTLATVEKTEARTETEKAEAKEMAA